MSLPTAFIFDMDGTLVDNMRFHERAWLELLAESGVAVTSEEFHRRAAGRTNPDILREFLGDTLGDADLTEWADRKESRYRDTYRPHLEPVRGLLEFLREAQQLEVPMALATSGGPDNITFVLEGLGLGGFFTAVVSGDEVERGKPDPEMFLLAAQRLNVAPAQCVVFEDSRAGIEAAARAGMRTVVVAPAGDPGTLQSLPAVERVVRDFTEVTPRALLASAVPWPWPGGTRRLKQ